MITLSHVHLYMEHVSTLFSHRQLMACSFHNAMPDSLLSAGLSLTQACPARQHFLPSVMVLVHTLASYAGSMVVQKAPLLGSTDCPFHL